MPLLLLYAQTLILANLDVARFVSHTSAPSSRIYTLVDEKLEISWKWKLPASRTFLNPLEPQKTQETQQNHKQSTNI